MRLRSRNDSPHWLGCPGRNAQRRAGNPDRELEAGFFERSFYNQRGCAGQRIREDKQAVAMTRLSYHRY